MTSKEELMEKVRKLQEHSVSGVFETSEENMAALRELFDNNHEIFCPTEDTTFEQFCGYMVSAGVNFMQREFVNYAMRKMMENLSKK